MIGHHIRNFIPLGEKRVVDLYDEAAFEPGMLLLSDLVASRTLELTGSNLQSLGPPAQLTDDPITWLEVLVELVWYHTKYTGTLRLSNCSNSASYCADTGC